MGCIRTQIVRFVWITSIQIASNILQREDVHGPIFHSNDQLHRSQLRCHAQQLNHAQTMQHNRWNQNSQSQRYPGIPVLRSLPAHIPQWKPVYLRRHSVTVVAVRSQCLLHAHAWVHCLRPRSVENNYYGPHTYAPPRQVEYCWHHHIWCY